MSKLTEESVYFLVVSKENGVFHGKKLLFELGEKYSMFKKERIDNTCVSHYILDKGMYCSLNYTSQQRELQAVNLIASSLLSIPHTTALTTLENDHIFDNQMFLVVRINQSASLAYILRNLTTELKFKIINLLVVKQFEWHNLQYLSTLFS